MWSVMSDPLGLSIGTTNLVAARVGNQPVRRRSVLTLPSTVDLTTDRRLVEAGDDPGLAALIYNFGRYLMIASSRPGGIMRCGRS